MAHNSATLNQLEWRVDGVKYGMQSWRWLVTFVYVYSYIYIIIYTNYYHWYVLIGWFTVSTATICYVCSQYDSECEDDYSKPQDHEIQCYDEWDTLENGGCSKVKSRTWVSGTKYEQGELFAFCSCQWNTCATRSSAWKLSR